MPVQSSFYTVDGVTRTFPSSKHIATKQHMAVWLQKIIDDSWVQLEVSRFELITNSAVLVEAVDIKTYQRIEIRVADTLNELEDSLSNTAIVASIASDIITVSGISAEVVTVAGDSAVINTVAGDTIAINIVAGDSAAINVVAGDTTEINIVAGDTIQINLVADDLAKGIGTNQPTDSAILNALTNAGIAIAKAGEASVSASSASASATSAQLKAWESEAERLTANSYASEAENVPVNIVTSDGDGTFTYTPTNPAEYSALHYSNKSNVGLGMTSYVDTISDLATVDTTITTSVVVKGYFTQGDGGGGIFNYDATQSAVNDGGTIIDGWVRQYSGEVNIKWFGAKCDEVTDDTSAILAAIATGKIVRLGGVGDISLITSSLTLSEGQGLIGYGGTLKTTSNITILKLLSDSSVEGVVFLGNSVGASQRGVDIDGGVSLADVASTRVSKCVFKLIGGDGYRVTRTGSLDEGHILESSFFEECTVGVNFDIRGEYTSMTGCNVSQCTTGVIIKGGNNILNGCHITRCNTGVNVAAGENDAHGAMTGCTINHSVTTAIYVGAITVDDFRFTSCDIFYGNVFLYRCSGVKFSDCTFGSNPAFYFQGAIDNSFISCHFLNTVPTMLHNYLGEASKTHFVDTTYGNGTSGLSSYDMNGGYISVAQTGLTNIDITSVTTPQVMKFNTIRYNAMTHNLNYTYESFYNTTTGIFNLNQCFSPNRSHYVDVNITVSIGGSNKVVDYDKINVYLRDTAASSSVPYVEGILTPLPNYLGTNSASTTSYKTYSLKGRIVRGSYELVVENKTGLTLIFFRDQGLTVPSEAVFSNL